MASPPTPPPTEQAQAREILGGHLRVRERRILVVDDEPDILGSFKTFIEACLPGVRVHTATNGQDALTLLETIDPHLIVSDLRMPGMDGLTFLREAAKLAPEAPRVLVTAYPDLDVALDAKNSVGVDRLLTKPVDPLDVVALLYDLLRDHQHDLERDAAYQRAVELLGDRPTEGKA